MLIAVVIPFYQKEDGILRQALDGVWAQQLPDSTRLQIIVVDDASPHPAKTELEGVKAPAPHTLTIIRQANGGPGSARNAALDSLTDAVEYIALLDSDDVWRPQHLADAIRRLEAGADFYFCDHFRPDWNQETAFHLDTILQDWLTDPASPLEPIEGDPDARALKRERAVETFVTNYMAQTSTVVYRRATLGELRFDTRLRTAGEDHLFWIEAASHGARVVFSLTCNVVCGTGVNLYFGSFDWLSPEASRRFAGLTLFYTILDQRQALPREQKRLVRRRRQTYGRAFVYLWLHFSAKTRQWDWKVWRPLLDVTPLMGPRLAAATISVTLSRIIDPSGFFNEWE